MTTEETTALVALAVPVVSSLVSIFVPSGSRWMRLVDMLALNVGKARNDPGAQ